LLDLEEFEEDRLKQFHSRYETLARKAREHSRCGQSATDIVELH